MDLQPDALTAHFARLGPVVWLESQSASHPWSQVSYLAADPQAELIARNGHVTIRGSGRTKKQTTDPWKALHQFRRRYPDWLFGYLGYDLKNYLENLHSNNPDNIGAPDLYMMVPRFLLKVDHWDNSFELLKGAFPAKEKINKRPLNFKVEKLRAAVSKEEYQRQINRAKEHIREGDFYEVNLSHQLKANFEGNPLGLYQAMRSSGPVPFGAYLQMPGVDVCCQSPERFLRKKGTEVFSQPIKGTSPRSKNAGKDAQLKKTLQLSIKEQAENLMIVDLVRNDLSRVARPGSVSVEDLFAIESFETVHQMVSTIKAKVGDHPAGEILQACFPMGSMTGAPKIRAMQAIETLENYRRGIYSGAIGYLTPAGDFDFNVVIRTALIHQNSLYYSTGGAITSDSDPAEEWRETLLKARALTDAAGLDIMDMG